MRYTWRLTDSPSGDSLQASVLQKRNTMDGKPRYLVTGPAEKDEASRALIYEARTLWGLTSLTRGSSCSVLHTHTSALRAYDYHKTQPTFNRAELTICSRRSLLFPGPSKNRNRSTTLLPYGTARTLGPVTPRALKVRVSSERCHPLLGFNTLLCLRVDTDIKNVYSM